MQWLWRWYQRRLINVNVNILVAGFLALVPTVGVIHLLTVMTKLPPAGELDGSQKLFINGITFIVDIFFDYAIYYGLHWLANHSPWRGEKLTEASKPSFLKDATKIQFERLCLSPVFYIVALGGQFTLLAWHVHATAATAISFATAILATRALHTMWMLREERRDRRRAEESLGRVPGEHRRAG